MTISPCQFCGAEFGMPCKNADYWTGECLGPEQDDSPDSRIYVESYDEPWPDETDYYQENKQS